MLRTWYCRSVCLATLLMGMLLTSAHAWEFDLKGTFAWSHEWYNQQGSQGFFGRYDVDAAGLETANLNFWDGGQFDTNFVSGANACFSYFQVDFDPEIKINNAVRLYGHYRLGTWGNPANSKYNTGDAPGIRNGFSEGQWTQFWVAVNTPWGVFGVGKRPWKYGIGLQYDGSDSLTTESMTLTVPYGPFDIGIAYYPYRFVGSSSIPVIAARAADPSPYGDPYNLPSYRDTGLLDPDARVPGQFYSRADRSGSFANDVLAYMTYSSGPFMAGILGVYGSYHIGPEALLQTTESKTRLLVPVDSDLFHGTIYEKYNNGRFFLNCELAWLYWTDRFGADPSNGNSPLPAPKPGDPPKLAAPQTRYIEQLRAAIETGLVCGPAKISFLSVWSPGPDRRNGMYIDRQPAAFVRHPYYDMFLGNNSLIMPYSFLFAYDYGSGLNGYNLNSDGYIRDAFVLAGRLDYAVAANLNVFGSFFWAQRTSVGYERGCLRPNPATNVAPSSGNIDFSRVTPGPYMSQNLATPNITEKALGYEIGLGINWKVLEAWTLGVNVNYWAPGKWFSYACIDRSDPNWNSNNPITSDRNIDGVIGGMFNITSEF
ncbi:MAG: hypothetical protein ACLQO6_06000 [Desulfomonilaceae bacterium]